MGVAPIVAICLILTACGASVAAEGWAERLTKESSTGEGSGEGSSSTDDSSAMEGSGTDPTTAPVRGPVVPILVALPVEFRTELEDRTTPQFMNLERRVVDESTPIYRRRFPRTFRRCFVMRFRPVVTRATNTEAVLGVEFNSNTTQDQVPTPETVAQTLIEGVSNSTNSTFVTSSIRPIGSTPAPITTSVTTASVTTGSTPAPITTSVTTASVITDTAVPATTEAVAIAQIRFTSVGETFTSDLLNMTSPGFQSRATTITTELTPFFSTTFPTFQNLAVTGFSNGSIINELDARFASNSIPNATELANVLITASANITSFNIDSTSIFVNGILSSGASHKISLITTSLPVLLSWLLLRH